MGGRTVRRGGGGRREEGGHREVAVALLGEPSGEHFLCRFDDVAGSVREASAYHFGPLLDGQREDRDTRHLGEGTVHLGTHGIAHVPAEVQWVSVTEGKKQG